MPRSAIKARSAAKGAPFNPAKLQQELKTTGLAQRKQAKQEANRVERLRRQEANRAALYEAERQQHVCSAPDSCHFEGWECSILFAPMPEQPATNPAASQPASEVHPEAFGLLMAVFTDRN